MAGRFIKLYDKILKWEWFTDANTLQLFLYLLLKANYKNSTFQGVFVGRGKLITSLSKLGQATGQSIRMVRDNLKHLEMTGEVTSSATNRYRIITIVRYDDYQSNDKQLDKQMTSNLTSNLTSEMTSKPATSIEYIEYTERDRNNRKTATQFSPPTRDELAAFLQEIGSGIDPDYFLDYYNARGWEIKPRQKMKDWKATVRNWQRRETGAVKAPAPAAAVQAPSAPKKVTAQCYEQRDYSGEDDDTISAFMRRTEGLWK